MRKPPNQRKLTAKTYRNLSDMIYDFASELSTHLPMKKGVTQNALDPLHTVVGNLNDAAMMLRWLADDDAMLAAYNALEAELQSRGLMG